MSAKSDKLGELHALLADIMIEELKWYRDQDPPIPVPAADKAAVAKFLKDNNVTSDPVDDDDIQKLREEFQKQSQSRMSDAAKAAGLADDDIESLYMH
jgi:hypothetical protein